jgi:hypothetical protein
MAGKNNDLNERVAKLGFPLLDVDERSETSRTLAEVVRSRDARLWEGFPVMLANALDADLLDHEQIRTVYLESREEVCELHCLIALSLALYHAWGFDKPQFEMLSRYLHQGDARAPDDFSEKLKSVQELNVCGRPMSSERLMTTFRNYYVHHQPNGAPEKDRRALSELLSAKQASDLEYALSQVFSAKQKELVQKKFRGEKLTKTEKEYFSRTVRKKLLALANLELHQLATKLVR